MSEAEVISIEVETSQVPAIIQGQFDALKDLGANVTTATEKAEKAKQSAASAKEKSYKAFHKKEAVESLQSATVDLADAQISAAQAQEVSFEYQQKLAEMTKYLFALGVSNISMNRSVVRELELKLNGASKDELDEFARKEILAVVQQLKAQEDIMSKQNDLSNKVKAHEIQLQAKTKKDDSQDEEIARQAAIDKELGRRIDSGDKKDKAQDEEIARQATIDEEHTRLINELKTANADRVKEIEELRSLCAELSERLSENVTSLDSKEHRINGILNEKSSKKAVIISYVIGAIGIIVAIIQFFV